MAILVSRGSEPSYLVYTHAEFLYGLASDEARPRVRVKMRSSASGLAELLRLRVDQMYLSVRARNCLMKFKFAYQVAMLSDAELDRIEGVGKVSFTEIRCVLCDAGFPDGRWVPDA